MCEVWKWICIGTFIPLIVTSLYVWPPFVWWFTGNRTKRLEQNLAPYQRVWWLGVFVVIFSLVIYVIHCA